MTCYTFENVISIKLMIIKMFFKHLTVTKFISLKYSHNKNIQSTYTFNQTSHSNIICIHVTAFFLSFTEKINYPGGYWSRCIWQSWEILKWTYTPGYIIFFDDKRGWINSLTIAKLFPEMCVTWKRFFVDGEGTLPYGYTDDPIVTI